MSDVQVESVVTCPDCKGSGEQFAMFIKYAPGSSGPAFRNIQCLRCQGAKTVPAGVLEWIARGSEIREWRKAQGHGLRAFAVLIGVSPVLWCKIEAGSVDNSNWRELVGVLAK